MASTPAPAFSLPPFEPPQTVRRVIVLLGDQLDPRHLDRLDFDPARDLVALFEVAEEATHVPSHRARTALFLAAMRHFARDLADTWPGSVAYVRLDDAASSGQFAGELRRLAETLRERGAKPDTLVLVRPGEHRVLDAMTREAEALGWTLELVENAHFLVAPPQFDAWAEGRKSLVMETFYRWQRKRLGLLLEPDGKPVGGSWNFDADNRKPLGRKHPPIPPRLSFEPDAITQEVLELVDRVFPDAPGTTEAFGWPTTRAEALQALEHFVEHRLPHFGTYQDAIQTGEPWLFHSLLSPALNLSLLDPREVVAAAIDAYTRGEAPLNAVEGFVRQVIGWREFIRGVYWREGPDYETRNGLDAGEDLPELYWSGETDMACLRDSVGQVLDFGYGHHIQRLMVTGLFSLLLGVRPKAISDWYLGMYVDGVDWVTLPNTLGMAMHADGGVVGTKPYIASGRYIDRMSDACASCRFDPKERLGEEACPFTTLYWDFLARHRERFAPNRRMKFQIANLDRLDADTVDAIQQQAAALREEFAAQR